MNVHTQAISAFGSSFLHDRGLSINMCLEGDRCVIYAAGELDNASRHQLLLAATAGNHAEMVIDLTGLTFMDCSGYGALVKSRRIIERSGRTLTIRGQNGEPERLSALITTHDLIDTAAL